MASSRDMHRMRLRISVSILERPGFARLPPPVEPDAITVQEDAELVAKSQDLRGELRMWEKARAEQSGDNAHDARVILSVRGL